MWGTCEWPGELSLYHPYNPCYLSESAATLEAESGYTMESPEVAEFRRCILDADWARANAALMRLGVADDERLWASLGMLCQGCPMTDARLHWQEAKFLISQQKYLELLEANKITAALHVLRNELAPMDVDPDSLHALSRSVLSDAVVELTITAEQPHDVFKPRGSKAARSMGWSFRPF